MKKPTRSIGILRLIGILAIMASGFLAIVGTGGGDSGGNSSGNVEVDNNTNSSSEVMTDAQTLEKTRSLLEEVETSADASDKALYENIENEISNYPFNKTTGIQMVITQDEPSEFTLDPENAAEFYQMVGIVAFLQGSMNGALWASLKSVLASQDTAANLAQVGTILNEMERYEEAIQYLLKAKSLGESDTLMMSLGYSYTSLGNYSKAQNALSRAVELNPDGKIQLNMLMDLYLQHEEEVNQMRQQVYSNCYQDLRASTELYSRQATTDFINIKTNEVSAIAQDMMDLTTPSTLSQTEFEGYMAHNQTFTAASEEIHYIAGNNALTITDYFYDEDAAIAEDIYSNPSCGTPDGACNCATNYVSAEFLLLNQEINGMILQAGNELFDNGVDNIIDYDTNTNAFIFDNYETLSEEELLWAYNYLYKTIECECKTVAMANASLYNALYTMDMVVDTNYQMALTTCEMIEEALDTLARRKAEMEEKRQQELAEREARELEKKIKADEESSAFDCCLDSIACLGLDNSVVSVKIGGPLFAQFSADTSQFNVGVRVGVSLGDPTGNFAGADLSIGGNVSSSGTSLDVKYSHSLAFGQEKASVTIFNVDSN